MRESGLTTTKMNVNYGGAVPTMRSTTIQEVGNYQAQLSIGDTQELSFKEGDDGPFWMTPQQQLENKFDQLLGTYTEKERTKVELLVELRKKGIDTSKNRYLLEDIYSPENSIVNNCSKFLL